MPDQFVRPVISTLGRVVRRLLGSPTSPLDCIADCNFKIEILQVAQEGLIYQEAEMLHNELELQKALDTTKMHFLKKILGPRSGRKLAGRSAK